MEQKIDRIPVQYITAVSGVFRIRRDFQHFDSKVPENYPWPTGEKPKIYRQALSSLVSFNHTDRRLLMDIIRMYKDQGRIERVMIDSGGFQLYRRPEYNLKRLFQDNMVLYKQYDFADAYVLPDWPPRPDDTLEVMEDKAKQTMQASTTFFEQLPEHLQRRAMPVFHTRTEQHLLQQLEKYKHILDTSHLACYALPGTNKRLQRKHMIRIKKLTDLRPDLKLHLLGIAAPSSIWCMKHLGISTYDAISPITGGANGQVMFAHKNVTFSEKKADSVSIAELEMCRQVTNHRCPFCDDYERLKWDYHYRMVHNLIVMDEINHYLTNMTMTQFEEEFPQVYEWLSEALGIHRQQTLF